MLKKFIPLVFIAVFTASGFVHAKDCANAKDSASIANCHVSRYAAADKELNIIYGGAMKSLSDDEKTKFKDAQKAWLKYRDASFAFIIEANKEARSYGDIVVADYKATLVEKRVLEIKYLLSGPESPPVAW